MVFATLCNSVQARIGIVFKAVVAVGAASDELYASYPFSAPPTATTAFRRAANLRDGAVLFFSRRLGTAVLYQR